MNGELHRIYGPATISPIEGTSIIINKWYFNGKLHKTEIFSIGESDKIFKEILINGKIRTIEKYV